MKDVDLLVYTVAIPADNEEYAYAGKNSVPCVSRADYLGYLMSGYEKRIGVSGMHGKSTTTSMLSHIFSTADLDPTVSCGAVMLDEGNAYRIGGNEFFIFEACEYMDSFLDFYPTTAIILNIEMDHVDYFKSMAQNIDLSHGEEHAKITSSQIPANAETVLAPLPAQEQFRRLFPALCGTPLTAPT